ncbi:VPS26C [Symbiodinium sp. KB8]|nr:VPS26C [Symbiodinium sp. KB8]
MTTVEVRMGRVDRIYSTGEAVTGVVVIKCEKDHSHSGISCSASGCMTLMPGRSNKQELVILQQDVQLSEGGTLPAGETEIPFEFTVEPSGSLDLVETYHGVNVDIRYNVHAVVTRSSVFGKTVKGEEEFVVETPHTAEPPAAEGIRFEITPGELSNVRSTSVDKLPKFKIVGQLNQTNCCLRAPFTGEIVVEECGAPIKSIELQLVRVERTVIDGKESTDATEIQNLQVGDGDVARGLGIPLYMIFPRLFACPSVSAGPLSVGFEVNVHVQFESDYLVLENFPIRLYR